MTGHRDSAAPRFAVDAPLGRYVRLIVAGSRGLPAQRLTLATIELGADEPHVLEAVRKASITELGGLSVEAKVQWGALFLFLVAREHAHAEALPGWMSLQPEDRWPWLERGVELWGRHAVAGAAAALSLAEKHVRRARASAPAVRRGAIELEEKLPALGYLRLVVRCTADDAPPGALAQLRLGLAVSTVPDTIVKLGDAPGRQQVGDTVDVPLDGSETELFFVVSGSTRGSASVELRLLLEGHELARAFVVAPVHLRRGPRPGRIPRGR